MLASSALRLKMGWPDAYDALILDRLSRAAHTASGPQHRACRHRRRPSGFRFAQHFGQRAAGTGMRLGGCVRLGRRHSNTEARKTFDRADRFRWLATRRCRRSDCGGGDRDRRPPRVPRYVANVRGHRLHHRRSDEPGERRLVLDRRSAACNDGGAFDGAGSYGGHGNGRLFPGGAARANATFGDGVLCGGNDSRFGSTAFARRDGMSALQPSMPGRIAGGESFPPHSKALSSAVTKVKTSPVG